MFRSPIIRLIRPSRPFSTTVFPRQATIQTRYHFDTRKFAVELEKEGFTQQQSVAVLKSLSLVIDDSIQNLSSTLVTKEALSRLAYQQKVDFAKLKGALQNVDRSEFNKIKSEHERLQTDIEKLRQKLREEITKNQASVKLDLNLEKGRIREESSIHELKISETDTRIDQELANMKTQIDSVKTQVMQWLIGVCTGAFALLLAYIRLLS